MLERDITTKILAYLKTLPDCFFWKQPGGLHGTAGLPDVICCFRGMFVAFEVKTSTGKLTKLQEATINRIRKANGRAFKVTGVDEVVSILDSLEVMDENCVGVSGQESSND